VREARLKQQPAVVPRSVRVAAVVLERQPQDPLRLSQ